MDRPLTSCLYECEVVHQRLHPKRHGFRYRLFFLDLDLEELPELSRRLRLFGAGRRALFEFRDNDHLDLGQPGGLRANLAAWMEAQGCPLEPGDQIRLVTLPRVLGYIFNPVCFYFIRGADGEPRRAVVEVCNTFRELKPYLIPEPASPGRFRRVVPKHFYVSPFTSLTAEFDFRLQVPGDAIEIHIDDREDGRPILVSWIRGKKRALTDARLLWCAFRYPFATVLVILRIHWQALRLWMKRLPFHRKAQNPELQRDLLRPRSRAVTSAIQPKSPPAP